MRYEALSRLFIQSIDDWYLVRLYLTTRCLYLDRGKLLILLLGEVTVHETCRVESSLPVDLQTRARNPAASTLHPHQVLFLIVTQLASSAYVSNTISLFHWELKRTCTARRW